jgi:uncharacterized protein DUF1549/uncharacterized protein DUF1553/cytochrome c
MSIRWGFWLGLTLLWCVSGGMAALSGRTGGPPGQKASTVPSSTPAAPADFFRQHVRPLLEARCFTCHGEKTQMSGLRLDSREAALKGGTHGPALVPGQPEKSPLIRAIHHTGKLKMPPSGKLNDAEIAILTNWVKAGAPFPKDEAAPFHPSSFRLHPSGHWSFQPVRRPRIPAVKNKQWVKTPIDAFVLAELEKRGLKPSPYADRRTLIRRVSFDLTGLPPTPEEVDEFLADRSPDAWAKVVDRLLASKQYGERMALEWLDLARYADTDGYHDDTDRSMWAFRDYVINSFNKNKPFNQFTIEQLAGDLLVEEMRKRGTGGAVQGNGEMRKWGNEGAISSFPHFLISPADEREALIGSAFNRCGPTSSEGGAIPEEYMAKYAVDRVNTTASVWMGLTVQCSECHNHKYDPITTKEYYQLFAFFNQVPEQVLYRGADAPPVIAIPTPEQQAKLDELGRQITALEAEAKTRPDAPDPKAETARVGEAAKKLEEVKKVRVAVERMTKLRIMADVPERRPTHVLVRGDYRNHGEVVQPGVPAVLGALPADMKPNRLALATWLVDPRNPVTARVTVNRFWQMIFGKGIVKTSEDFGARGEPPSHPELLDWLASYFVEGNEEMGKRGNEAAISSFPHFPISSRKPWDTKALLRLIVTSAAYQQSSRVAPGLLARDPENRLLTRGPRFRLSAEAIRDNALAISGLLDRDRAAGGPSVRPYQPGDLWRELSSGDQKEKSYVQDHGPDLYRRGLYVFWKRSILYPSFAVYDAPKREVCVIRRPITNTPLQAFASLNDVTYMEAARVFAQRILQKGGVTVDARLTYAMRTALARPPTSRERQALANLYQATLENYRQDSKAALKLVSTGEWPRPQDLDVSEHAAWTCVCNAILNLDETITKE